MNFSLRHCFLLASNLWLHGLWKWGCVFAMFYGVMGLLWWGSIIALSSHTVFGTYCLCYDTKSSFHGPHIHITTSYVKGCTCECAKMPRDSPLRNSAYGLFNIFRNYFILLVIKPFCIDSYIRIYYPVYEYHGIVVNSCF